MRDIRSVEQTLSQNLSWHRARIKFVAAFIVALVTVKNVNLMEIACALDGKAKQSSQYKKLQRFFRFFELPYADVAQCIVKLLGVAGPWQLTLDRTNWEFGRTDLNILMLGIVHQGIAYPLIWLVLPKAGNSHTEERIAVMEIFIDLFGKEQIAHLLADREFVGKDWLKWLRNNEIDFRLRVRENFRVANGRGQLVSVWRLFRSTRVNQPLVIEGARRMWGDEWYFSGCYLGSGQYLIIVSPTPTDSAVSDYARRWEIETLFAALKTRGFCLEQTHLTDGERLSRLLALMAITFCWCHKIGEWLHQQKVLKLNNLGRRPQSLFRRGFDHLRRLIVNFSRFDVTEWLNVIKLLSCT
ncbi:MAG: IS4 family transposase [Acidobacteria bacterium]|nr:IS4 family transposase [Acidobacteriota bacterium]